MTNTNQKNSRLLPIASILVLLTFLAIGCFSSNSLAFENVREQSVCAQKGGTWYNNKCWKGFEDDGIKKEDIDATVERQMAVLEEMNIQVDGKSFPISFLMPEQEDGGIIIITVYNNGTDEQTLLTIFKEKKLKKKDFEAEAVLFKLNLLKLEEEEGVDKIVEAATLAKGNLSVNVINMDDFKFHIKGALDKPKDAGKIDISFNTNEAIMGAGTSTFEISGNEAILNGDLGTKTYHQLKNIIDHHPEVKTIVLGEISGSVNDAVNMHTGRILREAGLNTKVLSNSTIASGGVDLFCAGKERIVEKGAKIGIHSWCCVNDLTAIEIPKEHPAHKYQVAYFSMCLGAETGPAFYFRTLEAAPFDDVHWMTDEAIQKWLMR